MTTDAFGDKAADYAHRMVGDLGCGPLDAFATFGNAGRESGGFKFHHELGKKAGQGGYGWFQWTADRRVKFFAYCNAHKYAPESDEASYGFLIYELKTSEKATMAAMRAVGSLSAKVAAFERVYERARVKAIADRLAWAQRVAAAYDRKYGTKHAAAVKPAKLAHHVAHHPTRHLRRRRA